MKPRAIHCSYHGKPHPAADFPPKVRDNPKRRRAWCTRAYAEYTRAWRKKGKPP